jgi:microsomal dipeptidase-like Zn-dependent dipeptidase
MVRMRVVLGLLAATFVAGSAVAAPPSIPAGLSADTSVPGQVTLTWSPASGADSYRIYRRVDPLIHLVPSIPPQYQFIVPVSPVATATGPSYTDTGLPPLVRQFYVVTAVNADGESPLGLLAVQREVRVTAPPDAAVFGFADLHTHQFANVGFGGKVVFGEAFSAGGVGAALPVCNNVHGFAGLGDIVDSALRESFGHPTGGHPNFDGWPLWRDYTHQQMYVDWVRRAYDGGLRLMVVHAVNNRVLCSVNGQLNGYTCDDMEAVDRQLQAAKDMEAFVDAQSGGPGKGWYRIAYSAADARRIINAGGLAVVLGMEVDEPFGCGILGTCTDADVQAALGEYHARGVRHFFPVHVIDNAFGGSAMYEPLFTYANKIVTHDFFGQRECGPEGFRYKTGQASPLLTIVGFLAGTGNAPTTTFAADCNDRSLTPLGGSLVRGLMRRKMIVDMDHMSALTASAVLGIAEQEHYPLVGGHTGILAATLGDRRHEGLKTDSQLERVRNLGGMVGVALHEGTNDEVEYGPAAFFNNCSNSSRTFAQAYMAAVDAMGGPGTAMVALGSDFNGLAGTLGPRFGADECTGNANGVTVPQDPKLAYPFPIEPPAGVTPGGAGFMSRMPLANHLYRDENGSNFPGYDFNYDGLAHAGLLPDFVADLRSVLPTGYLAPLFRSAEGYLQVWEAIDRAEVFRPAIGVATSPAAPASGWFTGNVTVIMTGTPNAQGGAVTAIRYGASGAHSVPETSEPSATASLLVTSEGTTTVTAVAEDSYGTLSLPGTVELRVDRTGPTAVCAFPDGQWHAANISLGCTASDALSGLADPADAAFLLSTSVPAGVETADAVTGSRSLLDVAGNARTAGPVHGNRVDRKPPSIDVVVPGAAVYAIHQSVAASYGCTDGGSGLASCAGPVPPGGAVDTTTPGTKTFTVSAADALANASSRSVTYDVAYNVCLLYDPTTVKKAGSTVPVKLRACDAAGANLSQASVAVVATSLIMVSSTTTGPLEDAGNANPDGNFRYDGSLAGYIYNLRTTGLAAGTWELRFRIAGDPTEHGARFQIR